jgi:hypothetical protein
LGVHGRQGPPGSAGVVKAPAVVAKGLALAANDLGVR